MEHASKTSNAGRIFKWSMVSLAGFAATLLVVVLLVANSQDGSVKILQGYLYSTIWGGKPNSFAPRTSPRDEVRADGLRVRHNIRYGDRFPNSYLDIWSSSANDHVSRPTVIFLHGGGWFMGDKDMGDPIADKGPHVDLNEALVLLAKQGLDVVNLDYALAPEYRYPVPLYQLNEAIQYLVGHAAEYGLDVTKLVIMGGSAGAQMAAQYGLIVSDPAYAADVGIVPAVNESAVRALVIFSAPLKVSGFGWRMNAMAWAYLGTKDLDNSRQARQVDILSHIGPRYPATYLTDGNQPDTFPDHAKAMARILREHNIDYQFNYYEPSEALLGHGYTGQLNTKYGRDNFEKAIAFIKQHTGLSTKQATVR